MKLTTMILATAVVLGVAGEGQAMPAASLPTASATGGDAAIVLARGGCGFGAHRGPYGGCRLNRGPRGAIRQQLTGAPGGCPPGLYRGRFGRCHRRF